MYTVNQDFDTEANYTELNRLFAVNRHCQEIRKSRNIDLYSIPDRVHNSDHATGVKHMSLSFSKLCLKQ